eukprot:CAMPEP_0197620766 /NCGR_PEP_ID=MMETSP1338-20131121/1525_1 /TAXON_ID=43686 ORGANISM="Pelagodinium beii, Strain RCC1491" /NCGR_SAMPLE_ID=MMETSP1338 /ASSEMBLY_ACC=CAM_ASM_000754 /LENGTH=145 /DNA_ID=CAMNT_0043190041 /DNA_START=90 /DNA_END=527 /DNA_ORIENTATION=-
MAATRSMLAPVAILLACAALLSTMTSFCSTQPAMRATSVARPAGVYGKDEPFELRRNIVEITVTSPAHGSRTRLLVEPDESIEHVLTRSREAFDFNVEWIPNSDWQMYKFDDEEAGPFAKDAKLRDCGLVDHEYELHLYFEPKDF